MQTADIPADARNPARMLRTTFFARCPSCERGPLFAGVYRIRETCLVCRCRFERNSGNWTGPVVLGYGLGALAAFAAGLLLYLRWGGFEGLEWAMLAVGIAVALAGYRPIKAWWIWLLWATGLVFPDRGPAVEASPRPE